VVEFVRRGIAAKQELHLICENMMDNCLASNSETGGVGCDNMTMIVIGLLGGKSKEGWYNMIGERVSKGDGPCAPPEYGKSYPILWIYSSLMLGPAEFRGPGVRHQFDHDSPDEYELDLDRQSRGFGGRSGRIILLGDGTEVLTDSDDADMFDHTEEDHDSENQIHKGVLDEDSHRGEREGTPAPQSSTESNKLEMTQSPSSTTTNESSAERKDS
jgi:protein phosphatase 2C family protein 2/3